MVRVLAGTAVVLQGSNLNALRRNGCVITLKSVGGIIAELGTALLPRGPRTP